MISLPVSNNDNKRSPEGKGGSNCILRQKDYTVNTYAWMSLRYTYFRGRYVQK